MNEPKNKLQERITTTTTTTEKFSDNSLSELYEEFVDDQGQGNDVPASTPETNEV